MSQVKWFGAEIKAKVRQAEVKALSDAAEFLLEEANRKVPHDEGTLERSGETDVSANQKRATVSYDTPYAARLHEHPEYRFQKGREGKWLENAFKNNAERIRNFFFETLKQTFK